MDDFKEGDKVYRRGYRDVSASGEVRQVTDYGRVLVKFEDGAFLSWHNKSELEHV